MLSIVRYIRQYYLYSEPVGKLKRKLRVFTFTCDQLWQSSYIAEHSAETHQVEGALLWIQNFPKIFVVKSIIRYCGGLDLYDFNFKHPGKGNLQPEMSIQNVANVVIEIYATWLEGKIWFVARLTRVIILPFLIRWLWNNLATVSVYVFAFPDT